MERNNPVKRTTRFTVPLTRLAELAVGNKNRWKNRGYMVLATTDPVIFRVELWHAWTTDRARLFFSECSDCRVRAEAEDRRTKVIDWLMEKYRNLENARNSGHLLRVDVTDQIVGP